MLDLHAVLTVFWENEDKREGGVLYLGTKLSNSEPVYSIPYPEGTESAQNFTFACSSSVRKENGKWEMDV